MGDMTTSPRKRAAAAKWAARLRRLFTNDAARRAGISPSTWKTYRSRDLPKGNPIPTPDGTEYISGHVCPWWYEATVDAWVARRKGSRGRPRKIV